MQKTLYHPFGCEGTKGVILYDIAYIYPQLFTKERVLMEAKKRFIVNCMFYGIILLIVALVGKYILPIMTPFIIAFCVSGLMEFLTKRIIPRKEKLRRLLSLVLCGVLYAVVCVVVLLVGSRLISEAITFVTAIPGFVTNELMPLLNMGAEWLENTLIPVDARLASMVDELASSMMKSLGSFVTNFSGKAIVWLTSSATSIPGLIVQTVITVISTFFMVLDFSKVVAFLKKLVPAKQRGVMETGLQYTRSMVLIYIKSYSILFLLTFVELTIGFLILGISHAPLLAATIAVFDLMPILGTGGILLPWALVALILDNLKMAIGILLLYLVITFIRQTLEPKIVGKQIGLHPLATLIAMLLGLNLFGLVGLIGLPVLLSVITAMNRTRMAQQEKEKEKNAAETAASAN